MDTLSMSSFHRVADQPYFRLDSPLFAHINILRGPGKKLYFCASKPYRHRS